MHSIPDNMVNSQQYQGLNKPPKKRPYCCDSCSKQFETPSKLARHNLTHTGQKPFPCQDCSKTFRQLVHLERHMMTHMLPFQCNICHRHFKNSETFSRHQQLHQASAIKEVRLTKKSPTPRRKRFFSLPLYCFGCQKTFESEEKHLLHQCDFMNVTGVRKAQPRRCDFCSKMFPTRSKLERHLMTHTGQRPFACALCGKAFRQKTHLKIHLLTHSEEKPFECSQCPKAFKMLEKLVKHQKKHTKLPNPRTEPQEVKQEGHEDVSVFVIPFQCSPCGLCFDNQEHLDNHKCLTQTQVPEAGTATRRPYNRGFVKKTKTYECHLNEIGLDGCVSVGRLLKAEPFEESDYMDTSEAQKLDVTKNLFRKGKPRGKNIRPAHVDQGRYIQHHQLGMNFPGLLEKRDGETIFNTFHGFEQHGEENHSLHQFLQGAQGILQKRKKAAKCDQCNKTFLTMSKLRRHYLIHTGQKPFTCTECGKTFRQSAHLKRHQVTHLQKASVLGSQDRLEDYDSAICQQEVTSLPLSQHYDPAVNTEELGQALTVVVPDIKVESESLDLSSGIQKRVTRKKARISERSAKSHQERSLQKMRTRGVRKSYKCSVCPKVFRTPSKLERHYLMHAGQKPFECKECGKFFRQDPHLKRHMQTHIRMKKQTEG
ncbi:zinc finger protein 770-like isoform X4 [Hyla sarda]|uniref:zinc finger protein 770-like isoform X4 n=1 Tax=Hyla sarda TaxID=327740 RepID=UPI0024C34E06|nr:zinc finger protein 770-like isoform X4 [Hyla sarda]